MRKVKGMVRLPVYLTKELQKMRCSACGSGRTIKYGHIRGHQAYRCKDCQRVFLASERDLNKTGVQAAEVLSELEASTPFQRIGVLDIETTGLWSDFGYVLCAVFKDITTTASHRNYEIFRLDETEVFKDEAALENPAVWRRIDRELLEKVSAHFRHYDIIVHFNGRQFDMKFLTTRLIKNNLEPLPQVKQVDIYQVAKYRLRLRSKSLEALREFLEVDMEGGEHKWEYWQMAGARLKTGFDYVVEHCCRDVDRIGEVAVRMKTLIQYIK